MRVQEDIASGNHSDRRPVRVYHAVVVVHQVVAALPARESEDASSYLFLILCHNKNPGPLLGRGSG